MSKSSSSKWALGAIIAAVVGYLAGILTAPKSGKETRQDIKNATESGIAEAEKQLKKLHTQISDLITQAKEKSGDLKGNAQKELQGAIDKAMTVKEKARVLLSSVHEGDAEDKDLQKAIDEASKAIESLKTFLQKQ